MDPYPIHNVTAPSESDPHPQSRIVRGSDCGSDCLRIACGWLVDCADCAYCLRIARIVHTACRLCRLLADCADCSRIACGLVAKAVGLKTHPQLGGSDRPFICIRQPRADRIGLRIADTIKK